MRIRIDVVQAHPHAQLRQAFAQFSHARAVRLAVPFVLGILHVDAIGAGVLRDHQQFPDPALDQLLGLDQHLVDGSRDQVAAHRRNDAEAAAVVAAFGNLQIRVVLRGQFDADVRHDVEEAVALRRQCGVHRIHHADVVLRSADRKHVRIRLANQRLALAEAAGDDDLAVLVQGGANRIQRLLHGRVDEAAGVHHHGIRLAIAGHDFVTLDLQLGQDALGIDQRLGAAEADETDLVCGLGHGLGLP